MFGDMLFNNTHSVEQLVDIKKKKKVDKVLLKVIKTIRAHSGISDWIKPESDLRKEFNISNKVMTSVCDILSEHYQLPLDSSLFNSVQDIVQYIKCHQQTAADSIFLVDSSSLEVDENNDVADDSDTEPRENLEVDPEIVSKSEADNPTEEKIPEGANASTEVITEAVIVSLITMAITVFIENYKKSKRKENRAEVEKAKNYFLENYGKAIHFIETKYCNESTPDKKKTDFLMNKEHSLYSMSTVYSLYERSRIQFNRIATIIYPKENEDDSSYKIRLKEYFKGRLTPLKSPAKETLNYPDAGYYNANDVRRNWCYFSHRFVFYRDQARKFIKKYEAKTNNKYKNYLKSLGVYSILYPSTAEFKERYGATIDWMSDLLAIFKCVKGDIKDLNKGKVSTENITESQEVLPELAVIIGVGGAVIAAAIKLYQDKKFADLYAWANEHYADICSYIKKNMKGEKAFYEKRDTLWRIDDLLEECDKREEQLRKLKNMPDPHSGEPSDLYKERLEEYFDKKMDDRIYPSHPAYLTIDEAGYLNATDVKSYLKKLEKLFDLQDDVDSKINNIRLSPAGSGLSYMTVLGDLNVMQHQRGLYKEQWPDNFNEHVLKVIARNIKNEKSKIDNPDSSESLSVSMEAITPQVQNDSNTWGNVLNSL